LESFGTAAAERGEISKVWNEHRVKKSSVISASAFTIEASSIKLERQFPQGQTIYGY
jgi:hypothetical protein